MSILKITSILLVCLVLQQCQALMTPLKKSVYHPNQKLIFDGRTIRDPRLFYALCDESETEKKCKIIRDNEPYQKETKECEVILKPKNNSGLVKKLRMVPFGKDKAIVLWLEKVSSEYILAVTSVKFSDCSTHEISTSVYDDSVNNVHLLEVVDVAAYENSYDLAFMNSKLCGDLNYCRITVDVEQNKTEGPVPWFSADHRGIVDFLVVDPSSPDKGVLVVELLPKAFFHITLVRGNDEKVLKDYEDRQLVPPMTQDFSSSNNLISICIITNETLKCSQYQQTGELTFEFEHPIGKASIVALHNLPTSQGLLILLNDITNVSRSWILKLDPRGKKLGTLDFRGIECDQTQNFIMGLFYEKDGHYCASAYCFENDYLPKTERGHLDMAAQCFTIDDITSVS